MPCIDSTFPSCGYLVRARALQGAKRQHCFCPLPFSPNASVVRGRMPCIPLTRLDALLAPVEEPSWSLSA